MNVNSPKRTSFVSLLFIFLVLFSYQNCSRPMNTFNQNSTANSNLTSVNSPIASSTKPTCSIAVTDGVNSIAPSFDKFQSNLTMNLTKGSDANLFLKFSGYDEKKHLAIYTCGFPEKEYRPQGSEAALLPIANLSTDMSCVMNIVERQNGGIGKPISSCNVNLKAIEASGTPAAMPITQSDYISLHRTQYLAQGQLPRWNILDGSQVSSNASGYKNLLNFRDELIGCNLGIAINQTCQNRSIAETTNLVYVYLDTQRPVKALPSRFRIWIPAGTKSVSFAAYTPQYVSVNTRIRFRSPPTILATKAFATNGNLPEDNLTRAITGQEFSVYGTMGGSLEVFSASGKLSIPLNKGGWLYVSQDGTTQMEYVSISLSVDVAKFKAEYDSLTYTAEGDPIESLSL